MKKKLIVISIILMIMIVGLSGCTETNQQVGNIEDKDTDGDGYIDDVDEFPNDFSEWIDTDGDGFGDNNDVFPNYPNLWLDRTNTSLTENGLNYICQNFGDENFCCVLSNISWYYAMDGVDTHETGATAQIVGRLAYGLLDSITLTDPPRGTYTLSQLIEANGGNVTIDDAILITYHDEPNENQWCYSP